MKKASLLVEEIISLCKDLSLTEEEAGAVILEGNLMKKGEEKLKLCLFGKFLANKTVNSDVFSTMMPKIWRTSQEVEIVDMNQNTFALYFKCKSDLLRIKAGGPWHFDNFILVLEEPSRFGEQASMQFNKVDFWIQISNVPLCCSVRETGIFLGSQLGTVLELDEEDYPSKEGGGIRVRVRVDVRKPLKRFLKLDLTGEGDTRLLVIRYERLPDFCYQCGLLGHGERDYATSSTISVSHPKPYDPWLRATSPQKKQTYRGKKEANKDWGRDSVFTSRVGREGAEFISSSSVPSTKTLPTVEGLPETRGLESQRKVFTNKEGSKMGEKLQSLPISDEEALQSLVDMSEEIQKVHNKLAKLELVAC